MEIWPAAPVGGDVPFAARLIVAKDVDVSILGIDLEPPLRGSEPAIDDGANLQPSLAAPERARLLLGPVARVTLDTNCHSAMVLFGPAAGGARAG